MNAAAMQDHLRDRMFEVTPEEFEVLCKMVLVRRLDSRSLEVTGFRQDDGIDIEGVIDEGILRALLGVQVKRYDLGNTVSNNYIQRFHGALSQGNHQIGTYITSSRFTDPAVEAADDLQICLVDGDFLTEIMVENEIGVEKQTGTYELHDEFWQAFEEPEREDLIPTEEVPIANNYEALRAFLEAIQATDGSRSEVHAYVNDELDLTFEKRHADLYGVAGWILGFVHKDTPKKVDGRKVRRWGLTRTGMQYLTLHEEDAVGEARDLLVEGIRETEIIKRIYSELEAQSELTFDELEDIMRRETAFPEDSSSLSRRRSTVGKWLATLPEVEEQPHGRSKKYILV